MGISEASTLVLPFKLLLEAKRRGNLTDNDAEELVSRAGLGSSSSYQKRQRVTVVELRRGSSRYSSDKGNHGLHPDQ
jgi:hypothetical protein